MDGMISNCFDVVGLDVSGFNIASLTAAAGFMTGSEPMLTANYDATLVNWQAQPHQPNVSVDFGLSKYTGAPSPAATARAALVSDGWTITDGGEV
jgi:hypothetical protein